MKSLRSLLIFAVSTQSIVEGNLRGNGISNQSLESIRRLELEKKTLNTYKEEAVKLLFPDKADVSVDMMFSAVGVNFILDRMLPSKVNFQLDEP